MLSASSDSFTVMGHDIRRRHSQIRVFVYGESAGEILAHQFRDLVLRLKCRGQQEVVKSGKVLPSTLGEFSQDGVVSFLRSRVSYKVKVSTRLDIKSAESELQSCLRLKRQMFSGKLALKSLRALIYLDLRVLESRMRPKKVLRLSYGSFPPALRSSLGHRFPHPTGRK